MSDHTPSNDKDPFYVGYLPSPRGFAFFSLILTPILIAVGVVSAFIIAGSQERDPGTGIWDLSQPIEIIGFADMAPYPVLRVQQTEGGLLPKYETVFVVSEGKIGAADRIAPLQGREVRATGFLIERDGMRMLELVGGMDAVEEIPDVRAQPPATLPPIEKASLGSFTLKGQIIDSKCYLGVMKPGEGKPHKSCATMCIIGGIPPMFMTQNAQGERMVYLVTDETGQTAVKSGVTEYIADWIEVTGEVETQGDIAVFKIDSKTIRRL